MFALATSWSRDDRLSRLQSSCKCALANTTWCNNIRGLTLNFKFLEQKGVSSGFLTQWMDGVKLHGDAVQPRFHRNHPSMTKHALWAEAEWSRLEKLGKLYFFPKGVSKPFGLNVNPCKLIIKARPDAQQAQNECDKYKVRLIVDLTRGLVNPALSNKAVQYGTVERAVSRMCSGDFLFVVDLMDCFFTWRVLPADSMLLGFYSESRQQFVSTTIWPTVSSLPQGSTMLASRKFSECWS